MCDPWIGAADDNAWLSFPFVNEAAEIIEGYAPNFVYVSHLHPDHHDQKTLKHLKPDTAILIKKYKDNRLHNKLASQGFTNIIDVEPWTSLTLGNDLEIVIVPAFSMVNRDIEPTISYDIDTSILIRCLKTGQVFYNNVDNPAGVKPLNIVREFSQKLWKKDVDTACLPLGAASEYPQCFINIDRDEAAARVIAESLEDLPERISALGINTLFIAGGTYVIRGKYTALNQYIAQPTFKQTRTYLGPWLQNMGVLFTLEGGGGIRFDEELNTWIAFNTGIKKAGNKQSHAHQARNMVYDYSDDCCRAAATASATKLRITAALEGALKNYQTIMGRIGIEQSWITEFSLYTDLQLDDEGCLRPGQKPIMALSLPAETEVSRQTLTLHMDADLFVDLLEARSNWNGALSGSYILYERTPDTFLPDIPFSLNFLVDRSKPYPTRDCED